MTMKEIATGLQHIGVPTGDMDATIHFYHALGFETIFETVNAEAGGRVNFFKLGDLVIETYEVTDPAKAPGAVDHIAINVKDIEEAFRFVNEAGLNNTNDIIHSLPFFENGVKFFTIEGANKEKVEFNQFL
ncbi:VOC family protein [Clostridiaceae bacterium Marseille-Q4145]|jgi:lactoylglutathione lyase|nr:VOC family protein [Clostridiaceae bacterium Marseille-Q4145]